MNTPRQTKKSLPVALVAVMALVLTTACGDRPITDVSEEEDGRPVLEAITATGNFQRPRGDVGMEDIVVANFDFSATDGFARGQEPLESFVSITSAFGAGDAFQIGAYHRTPSEDPRSPVATAEDASVDYWGLYNPSWCCGVDGFWDLIGEISGLEANTPYTVVLARMSLGVNGELDQNQVLTGRSIDSPDGLSLMGGSEAGYPDVVCNFTAATPVTPDMNPVALGYVETDEEGHALFDCLLFADESLPWWKSASAPAPPGAADSLPFGENQVGSTLSAGQYNYLLVYEGQGTESDPVPSGPPALRIQMGPDIDSNGTVVNNALSPFPDDVADVENLASLPGGGDAFAAPGTITFGGLGFMAGPTFEIGLYSRDDGTFTPVESQVVITDTVVVDPIGGIVDTVSVDVLEGVSTFTSPRAGAIVEITMSQEDSGVDLAANSHVVARLSGVEGSEFLYHEYLSEDLALSAGATAFGEFNPGGTSRVYALEGQGEMRFFGDSLLVDLSRVTREPPAGFHYQSYLIGGDGNVQRVHAVELDARGNAQDRIGVDEIEGDFANYNLWVLTTEPEGSQLTADGVRTLQVQVSEDYFSKFSDFFSR